MDSLPTSQVTPAKTDTRNQLAQSSLLLWFRSLAERTIRPLRYRIVHFGLAHESKA
jgi:hypothetical protein